ncbi:hypothetical protein BDZ94DRAFT_1263408 [Collybia nuda]|uniref:Uncharacterized protein n=1 Tax=Collybia nuda TaxID=64659 RepID=A0A9P5Y3F3_9AGAR|nr:hypothetical protein BDZ94DRAFT_1263408 [Collybia nuda]
MLHLTSEEAANKSNNIFIWRTASYNYTIVLSWRVDEDLPMTHRNMYRWVDEASEEHFSRIGFSTPTYLIFPVEIERTKNNPLAHHGRILVDLDSGLPSPPLARDSLERLDPGSYGLFTLNGEPSNHSFTFSPLYSIYTLKMSTVYAKVLVPQSTVEEQIRGQVKDRDGSRCCLTGVEMAENDLNITYIIPPWKAYLMMDRDDGDRWAMEHTFPTKRPHALAETVMTSSNCLTMSKKAIPLFEKNIIAIDVDDNYRIIRFYEGKKVEAVLGQPLKEYMVPNDTKADKFLRTHFLYSLCVHTYGGDHIDSFPLYYVDDFMDKMGLFEENKIEFSLKGGNYSSGEWDTYLGRQILAWFEDRPYEAWKTKSIEEFGIGQVKIEF